MLILIIITLLSLLLNTCSMTTASTQSLEVETKRLTPLFVVINNYAIPKPDT